MNEEREHKRKVGNLKNRRKAHVTFVQGRHPLISRRAAAYLPSLD